MDSEHPGAKEQNPNVTDANPSQNRQTIPQFSPTGSVPPVQTPPSPHSYQITCKAEKDWRDKVKFWAELVGILFLLIYTCETRRTNNLTQAALTQSQNQFTVSQASAKSQFDQAQAASSKQFQIDQRPYIWRTDPSKDVQKEFGEPGGYVYVGKKAEWRMYYSNYGKSPAIGLLQRYQVELGPNAVSKLRREKVVDNIHAPGDRNGAVLATGQMLWMSAFSKTKVSPNVEKFVRAHDGGIAVLVHFEYFDTYGNIYHSYVCELGQANGITAPCDIEEIK